MIELFVDMFDNPRRAYTKTVRRPLSTAASQPRGRAPGEEPYLLDDDDATGRRSLARREQRVDVSVPELFTPGKTWRTDVLTFDYHTDV
jgi:hypothetical protein